MCLILPEVQTSAPQQVLDLYLKQNDMNGMVFRLQSGNLKSELIEFVTNCQLIIGQSDQSSLEIIPFPGSAIKFPKEISHSTSSAQPRTEKQSNLETANETPAKAQVLNFFASCQCNKPQQPSISLTSNALDIIPGLTEPNGLWGDEPDGGSINDRPGLDSGADNNGGEAEMFSDNEKLTIGLVGTAVLVLLSAVIITVVILSKKSTISCFQAQSVSQQELNTEDILADLRRIVKEQNAGQHRATNI